MVEDPGLGPVRAEKSVLLRERTPRRDGLAPRAEDRRAVFRMNRARPAITRRLLRRHARDLAPARIDVDACAVGIGFENSDRRALSERPEPGFARRESQFSALALTDIAQHGRKVAQRADVHVGDGRLRREQRAIGTAALDPGALPIRLVATGWRPNSTTWFQWRAPMPTGSSSDRGSPRTSFALCPKVRSAPRLKSTIDWFSSTTMTASSAISIRVENRAVGRLNMQRRSTSAPLTGLSTRLSSLPSTGSPASPKRCATAARLR